MKDILTGVVITLVLALAGFSIKSCRENEQSYYDERNPFVVVEGWRDTNSGRMVGVEVLDKQGRKYYFNYERLYFGNRIYRKGDEININWRATAPCAYVEE